LAQLTILLADVDMGGRARLLARSSTSLGSWLNAFPSPNLSLCLGNEELCLAVGLRLGAPLVLKHLCVCGSPASIDGSHGLSCRRSAGHHSRHSAINETLARVFRLTETPVALEPSGLFRGDGKCPDGVMLVPWSHGRCLLWDFLCPDTLAPSHLLKTCIAAGAVAPLAGYHKKTKYTELLIAQTSTPVAIETLGTWGRDATLLVSELGRRKL